MGHVNFLVGRVCPLCLLRWRRKPDKLLTGWKRLWNTRRKPDRSIGNLGRTCWQDSVTFQNFAFQSPWEICGLWERKEGLRKASFQAMFRRKELKLLAGYEWFSHEWAEGHGLLLVLWQAETPCFPGLWLAPAPCPTRSSAHPVSACQHSCTPLVFSLLMGFGVYV